ncbi:MAG TPA: serine/threonine-protein kinase [Haliangium sp.]|nr:serine/threonine-protein kinase [Haliangium sp.]
MHIGRTDEIDTIALAETRRGSAEALANDDTHRAPAGPERERGAVRDLYGAILATGAVAGPYVVDEYVSQGGFASIYRAHHMRTGQIVALKVLHPTLARSRHMIRRFQQEAEAVNRLNHPNIVRLHELDELMDGRPFIAMEWLDGRTLRHELDLRGTFTAAEALAILEEIGGAVAAAHACGVVHRDIKATNVIALPRGDWFSTRLVDFGIAKLTAPDDAHTSVTTRAILGTPASMAPEQILGEPVDARTDVYALGILLFQLLVGRVPFDGADAIEIEQMHLSARRPHASALAPVAPAIDDVIITALAVDRDRRQATVSAFVEHLRAAVHGAAGAGPAHQRAAGETSTSGIAVLIRARARGDGDTARDAVDDVLDRAREAVLAAGLQVVMETGESVLAAAPLAGDRDRLRDAVLQAIGALVDGRASEAESVGVSAIIDTGEVRVARHVDGEHLTGGELLGLGRWPVLPAGLFAYEHALAGLAGMDLTRVAAADHAGLYRLLGPAASEPPKP